MSRGGRCAIPWIAPHYPYTTWIRTSSNVYSVFYSLDILAMCLNNGQIGINKQIKTLEKAIYTQEYEISNPFKRQKNLSTEWMLCDISTMVTPSESSGKHSEDSCHIYTYFYATETLCFWRCACIHFLLSLSLSLSLSLIIIIIIIIP